jgi:hypothetical protein
MFSLQGKPRRCRRSRTHRSLAILVDKPDATAAAPAFRLLADRSDLKSSIGFVSQKRSRFSPLLLWRPSKAHAWSATILVNELDPRLLEGAAQLLTGMI